MKRSASVIYAGVVLALGAVPPVVRAVDTVWSPAGESDWSVAGNWSLGEPTSANRGVINNGGTARVGAKVRDRPRVSRHHG